MEEIKTITKTKETSKQKRASIPQKDKDLIDVSKIVLESWKLNPELKMKWTTIKEFETVLRDYESAFDVRSKTGSTRPEITNQLKTINKNIDYSISFVKNYIAEKYTKMKATSYYTQFGLVKNNDTWRVPTDNNQRSQSLNLIVEGIQKHGFSTKTYGKTFWSDTKTNFNALLKTAIVSDQTVTKHVSSKNENKTKVIKIIRGLINQIKSNYPDTYKSELRNWGFQKEKY